MTATTSKRTWFPAVLLAVVVLFGAASFATPVAATHDDVSIHASVGGAVVSVAQDGDTVFVKTNDGVNSGGTATATVRSPNGGWITVTLYDDGSVDDPETGGNGDYWGSFTVSSGATDGTNDVLHVDDGNDATAEVDQGSDGTKGTATVTADYTAPQVQTVTTTDTNDDGDVDELAVTFTESIDDSASTLDASTFSLSSGSVDGVTSGGSADAVIVSVSGLTGTGVTPDVTLAANKVVDAAGNTLSSDQSPVTATDGASPVVTSGSYADTDADGTVDEVSLTFSEAVSYSAFDASDWTVTANGLSGLSLDGLSGGSGTSTLTFTASATAGTTGVDGASEPSVAYVAGGSGVVEDGATTPNEAVDGSSATLADGAKPTITDLEIRDTAGDGTIDEVVLTFSEYIDTDDGVAPVVADVGTLTLPDGSTADLSGATVTDPAGSSRTVTVSSIAGQSTVNTAAGSSDVAGDRSSNWVDVSTGANALVSTLDDESVTDGAAPVSTDATYRDTNADGTVDRVDVTYSEPVTGSYVDGEWSVATAGTVGLSKAGTGTVASPTVQIDVTGQTDTTGGATAPQLSYSGSSITDQSAAGNALASETITASDGAAPVRTAVEATDTNADGTVDRIDVTYSEDVSASSAETGDYSLGGTDAGAVSITGATASGSAVEIDVSSSLSSPSVTLSYDATAGTADSVTDGTNAAGGFTGVSVSDKTAPTLTAATTLDRDGDGNVDAATLTFSEAVSDASVTPGDYAIGGQAADAMDTLSTADDDTVQVRITADGDEVTGTGVADVTYTAGTTTDTGGNALGSVATADVSETDGAAPVVTSFSLAADTTNKELDVSFDASETLSTAEVSLSGPESATLTTFATSGSTYTASTSVKRNGDYTATLDTADDAAGNGATSTPSDTAAVSFVGGGSSSPSVLSGTSSRARLSGTTGLSVVGVAFSGSAATTVRVSEASSLSGSTPPGTFVSAADISVPESFTETPSTLKFAVSRDRLDELGVSPAALVVYRLHDGSWDALDTRVVDRGDTVVVEADTPGFSRFAVMAGGDAAATASGSTATAAPDDDGSAGSDSTESDSTGDANTDGDAGDASASTGGDANDAAATGDDAGSSTSSRTPGFGVGVALVALCAALALGVRRLD
ncbi:beta strand repeat-containing protein [Salinigranum sp. GCM10025319]|uniref:beta strand repeat-containing protein n=1 Tax=Salinigranum sp. GCM10025319 TaxID=3252687 RepID=UPI00360F9A7E